MDGSSANAPVVDVLDPKDSSVSVARVASASQSWGRFKESVLASDFNCDHSLSAVVAIMRRRLTLEARPPTTTVAQVLLGVA